MILIPNIKASDENLILRFLQINLNITSIIADNMIYAHGHFRTSLEEIKVIIELHQMQC